MLNGLRSSLARVGVVCTTAGLAALSCSDPVAPSARAGVLLLTVDTLRPDYMSMNGYPLPTTPFLDDLLAEGWYFDQAITPIAHTTPAIASLLTGAYPHTTGVRTLSSRLKPTAYTLAETLVADGYRTLATVTNHVLKPSRRLDRGFETYDFHTGDPPADAVTRAAIDKIRQMPNDQPLFAWVHYLDPHAPYTGTRAQMETFDPGYQGPYANAFWLQRSEPGKGPDTETERERGVMIHHGSLPPRVQEHIRRLYAASIRTFDDALSDLVDELRDRHGGNLIIVLTSDHGESLGENDYFWDHGDYVYNAGLRIPLAFVLPDSHRLHGSGRCSGWVSLVDVVPTLFELLEQPLPAALESQVEGRSLTPCMRGQPLPVAPQFSESGRSYYPDLVTKRVRFDLAGRLRGVMLGDWKLVWNPFQTPELEWELYDLRLDPFEARNFYSPNNPHVPALAKALSEWSARQKPGEMYPNIDEEDLKALRAMGYVQ